MFLLEKMLDEVVRTTQHQQLNKNSISRLSPTALLLRLCLLAVWWLNMSKGINPISQGCWGEIGRSVVWLLPPSMHAVKGGGWHRHRLWPRYTAFVHGRIQVVSDRHAWVCPAATFLFPLTADHSKKKTLWSQHWPTMRMLLMKHFWCRARLLHQLHTWYAGRVTMFRLTAACFAWCTEKSQVFAWRLKTCIVMSTSALYTTVICLAAFVLVGVWWDWMISREEKHSKQMNLDALW